MPSTSTGDAWPALPYPAWSATATTLQLWTQIVGKVRLALTPWLNHSWHVTLYVSARGLTTGLIPHGAASFDMEFDFLAHDLVIRATDGGERRIGLAAPTAAEFYARVLGALADLGVPAAIHPEPNEIPDPVPFPQDVRPRVYDPAIARDFWRVLVQVERVFARFRTGFIGKCSPVHLFWGSFDLAVTRFSGRPAPPREGPAFMRDAYSHEVISVGFWPGGGPVLEPVFYAYAVPEPAGLKGARVQPEAAYYHGELGEFVLPYDAVRTSASPDHALLAFVESTYERAATLGGWDVAALARRG